MDNNNQNDIENIFGEGLVDISEQPQPIKESIDDVQPIESQEVQSVSDEQPTIVVEPNESNLDEITAPQSEPVESIVEIQPTVEQQTEVEQPIEVPFEAAPFSEESTENTQSIENVEQVPVQEDVQPIIQEQPTEVVETINTNPVEVQSEPVTSAEEMFGAELIQTEQPVESNSIDSVIPQSEVQPVEVETQPIDSVESLQEIKKTVETPSVNEHPDAKIVLNKGQEENINEDVASSKLTKQDLNNLKPSQNKSLKFILVIGVIILLAIIIIPFIKI